MQGISPIFAEEQRMLEVFKQLDELRHANQGPFAGAGFAQLTEDALQILRDACFVPGHWRCPKCGFAVFKGAMRAGDGALGVNRAMIEERCDNCPTEWLVPLTWKNLDDLNVQRIKQLEEELAVAIGQLPTEVPGEQ